MQYFINDFFLKLEILGLFLGMSFLSFAELLEMIVETIVIILTRQKIDSTT